MNYKLDNSETFVLASEYNGFGFGKNYLSRSRIRGEVGLKIRCLCMTKRRLNGESLRV